jgi:serine/threonine-protein kinase
MDAAAARVLLRRAVSVRDWAHAMDAFFALVAQDPDAFREPALLATTRDFASAMALTGGEGPDRIYDALAHRAGSGGVDVLYEIVRTRGGSKGSTRALELLAKPDVIAHATPELRITVALRSASCADMPALLPRAASEGDARTLVVLQTVAAVCLGKSPALADAQKALKKRLR